MWQRRKAAAGGNSRARKNSSAMAAGASSAVAGARLSQHLVASTVRVLSNVLPTWAARSVVSPHGPAAAEGLALCGLLACVCTTWRDALHEALGAVAAQLSPGLLDLGTSSWATLRQRPWALQLRLVLRRVRMVRMWATQDLRGLCTLVHGGSANAGPGIVTRFRYSTWTLSRETVFKWLTQLFEFAAVGSVASLGDKMTEGVDVEEMNRARDAIAVSFASAVADRLSLEPYEDAVRTFPAAGTARFYYTREGQRQESWHGYGAEVEGLRTHIASLASDAWNRVALDATLPLHDSRRPSALIRHFSTQHSDLARLCQHSDPGVSARLEAAARERVRASIRKAVRRACLGEVDQEKPEEEQADLLDDSLLLEIFGSCHVQSPPDIDALRRWFRKPSSFACAKLWELSTRTQSFLSPSSVEQAVFWRAYAGTSSNATTDEAAGLRLCGRAMLGARWPECSSGMPSVFTPAVFTPRNVSHVQQTAAPATTVRSKSLVDMRAALSGPEHCRGPTVRTLTRDLQRVWRQAADLQRVGLPLVVAEPAAVGSNHEGIDLSVWRGMMQGPRGTAWEEGRFEFEMRIPLDDYPQKPPVLRFLSVADQRFGRTCCVFHPNVDERGYVCADVLATEWSSVCSIATLLLSVQSILDDPSCEHPANVQAALLLVQNRATYMHRVRELSRATASKISWRMTAQPGGRLA